MRISFSLLTLLISLFFLVGCLEQRSAFIKPSSEQEAQQPLNPNPIVTTQLDPPKIEPAPSPPEKEPPPEPAPASPPEKEPSPEPAPASPPEKEPSPEPAPASPPEKEPPPEPAPASPPEKEPPQELAPASPPEKEPPQEPAPASPPEKEPPPEPAPASPPEKEPPPEPAPASPPKKEPPPEPAPASPPKKEPPPEPVLKKTPGEGPIINFNQAPIDHAENKDALISLLVTDSDGVSSVTCQLNDEEPRSCQASHSETLTNLRVGTHSFHVVAVDNNGDTSKKSHSWNVNTVEIICNPFKNSQCSTSSNGLAGYIYYLNSSQTKYNKKLDGYLKHGTRIPTLIHLNQVNTPFLYFEDGFQTNDGTLIKDLNGDTLYEWFSLRISGFIMPNNGSKSKSYEFAMVSDDGMRVILDGKTILQDDSLHSPRWRCTSQPYVFAPSENKSIEIHYFQGPRFHLAMALLYRVAGTGRGGCPTDYRISLNTGNWKAVPSKFLFHKKFDSTSKKKLQPEQSQ